MVPSSLSGMSLFISSFLALTYNYLFLFGVKYFRRMFVAHGTNSQILEEVIDSNVLTEITKLSDEMKFPWEGADLENNDVAGDISTSRDESVAGQNDQLQFITTMTFASGDLRSPCFCCQ